MDNKINLATDLLNEDNLNLSDIKVNIIPNDILFPEELNQCLKGEIEFLLHKNGMLQRKISENEVQLQNNQNHISQLTAKISNYEQLTKLDQNFTGNPTQLMSAKIIEISKKLKDKTVENESLKTKYSKLKQKLINLENNNFKVQEVDNNNEQTEEDKSNLNEEIKILQEKLSQTNNKLFEVKNNNTQLKNDLKVANKILQQELGDNFVSIQNISSNTSTWRGRAQQILSLQQKNIELQEKLSTLTIKDSICTIPKVDPRKQIIEQLQKEITVLKNELEDTKKRINGSRARVKVLENECYSLKTKITTMTAKTEHDEKLISILTNQIASMEQSNNTIRKEKNSNAVKLEEENKSLKNELSKDKCLIEELRKILKEKDDKFQTFEEEMKCLKTNKICTKKTSSSSTKEISQLKILEVEVNRLLELVQVLSSRLNEERNLNSTTQLNYKKERQRAAKLELKLSRIELENSLNKSQSYSRTSLKSNSDEFNNNLNYENLKNSLELADENISILKTKLDILQKEKDLDYQRFSSILSETSSMVLKCSSSATD